MKKLTKFLLSISMFWMINSASAQEMRDSIVTRTITERKTHDTTRVVTHDTTYVVSHDSVYTKIDTIKVPVIPPQTNVVIKGMYVHPDQCTIGSATSENNFLTWAKREGVNTLNVYGRSFLYSSTKRDQLAAFVAKAKNSYGMILVTIDCRLTNSGELPGWQAYLAKYAQTVSVIEPLTEFEPWIAGSNGFDYPGFYNLVRTMGNLCKQYNIKMNFYEGWIGYSGSNFTPGQSAVDSMVKYCDRIFISNYVTVSDYTSTSASLGTWDNRMDIRCGYLGVACPRVGKVKIDVVEIVSLEPVFLYSIYACPVTATNKCNAYFGPRYDNAVTAYKLSTPTVLKYTNLVGRTIFFSKYAMQGHP